MRASTHTQATQAWEAGSGHVDAVSQLDPGVRKAIQGRVHGAVLRIIPLRGEAIFRVVAVPVCGIMSGRSDWVA